MHLETTLTTHTKHWPDMCFVLLMLLCAYFSSDSKTVRCLLQCWACNSSLHARSLLFNDVNVFPRQPHISRAVNLPLTLVARCLLNTNQFSVIKPVETAIPQPASAGYPPLYRSPHFELKYSIALMLLRLKPAGLDFQLPPPPGW